MTSGTANALMGIWGSSASNIYVTELITLGPPASGRTLHYDGSSWSVNCTNDAAVYGLWGSSASDVFAVGLGNGSTLSYANHYNGTAWAVMDTSAIGSGFSPGHVWGSSASDVYVVAAVVAVPFGTIGTMAHYNGIAWSVLYSGPASNWGAISPIGNIWGASASDVFGVCPSGAIAHYNGTAWSAMTSGTTNSLNGIWGSSGSNVFAVGNGGTIVHYNGSTWAPMTSGTSQNLTNIWGSSASDVFAVGAGGTIVHYNGSTWAPMTSGTNNSLNGIWGSSAGNVFAVGAGGTILHYSAPASSTTTSAANSSTTTVAVSSTTTIAVSSTTTTAPKSSTTTVAVSSTTTVAPVSSTTTVPISSTTTIQPLSTTTTIKPQRKLTVLSIAERGTVTGTGINCGSDCTESYDNGTIVTLTASPASSWYFFEWSGSCTGTGTCTLDMNDNKTVMATFVQIDESSTTTIQPVSSTTTVLVSSTTTIQPLSSTTTTIKPQRKLTVTKAGTGTGTVTGTGISCGSDCTEVFDNGTIVVLTAAAADNSTFTSWYGACNSTNTTCNLTMTDNKTVIATFTLKTYSTTTIALTTTTTLPPLTTTTIPPRSSTTTTIPPVSSTTTTTAAPAGVFKDDFNGDTNSDILLKNAAGSLYVLAGKDDGVAYGVPARIYKESTPATYTVVGTGDFNGDQNVDILLKNAAGSLYVLAGKDDGAAYGLPARIYKESTPATYTVVGTGDFNGDTYCDILLKNAAGSLYVLAGKADGVAYATTATRIYKESTPATYSVVGTGDFNNDTHCDILLKNAAGSLYVLAGKADGVAYATTATRIYKESTPATYTVVGTGDFNGDGNCDILLKNAAGSLYVLFGKDDGVAYATTATRIYKESTPATYTVVGTGDYNGDGNTDVLLKNAAGSLYVLAGKDDGVSYGLPARIYKESSPATYSVVGY